jgi:histidyl-tRNA synthetase
VLLGTRGHGPELLERIENLVIEDRTYKEGIAELKEVLGYLRTLSLPKEVLEVDFSIARGLGYYTGTVFETFLVGFEKTLGSVCSGGRYDTLMSRFIDRHLPGVGMSIGLTHLFAGLLAARRIVAEKETPAEVMVTVPDRNRIDDALGMANRLRHEGLRVELFVQDVDHDTQLKNTSRKGITIAVIPWPEKIDELDSIEVRNLVNGDRETVLRHEAASVIRFVLEKWRVYGS